MWMDLLHPFNRRRAAYLIASPSQPQTAVNNLVGVQFQLAITDHQGAAAKDTVSVIVNVSRLS